MMKEIVTNKECKTCKVYKIFSAFSPKKNGRYGVAAHCKNCTNKKMKTLYQKDPEKFKEQARLRYQKDPEKGRTVSRLEYKKDPEKAKNYNKLWRQKNTEYSGSYYKKNQTRLTERRLKAKYGMELEEYNARLIYQKGVCAICNLPEKGRNLAVDHCHKTNKIRGLLCKLCNAGIGMLKEDTKALQKAIEYLKKGGSFDVENPNW